MGAGKPAAGSEPSSGLSASGDHSPKTQQGQWVPAPLAQRLSEQKPSRRLNRQDPLAPPGEEQRTGPHSRNLQGLEGEAGSVPEMETLGHRLGEHSVRSGTRETGVMGCLSLGVHQGAGL